METDRVRINVSGLYFETYEATLRRFPQTLLGSPKTRKYFYNEYKQEYFFNRNRQVFDAVLFYYQSFGILRRPATIPEPIFNEELKFFEIENPNHDEITAQKVNQFSLGLDIPLPRDRLWRKLWLLSSRPNSSKYAKAVELVSIVLLILSVVTACVETMTSCSSDHTSKGCYYIDHICYGWFLFVYSTQFFAVREKQLFLTTFQSMVDILTIFPFYMQVIAENTLNSAILIRALKLVRITRVLRIVRHSQGIRALLYTIHLSWKDLQIYLIIVILVNILIASIAFFFEDGKPDNLLTSVPEAMWWSINTFTTVGYGDLYPRTTPGKIMGCACSVSGIVLMGLPVYWLVSNFLLLWEAVKHPEELGFAGRLKVSLKRMKKVWRLQSQKVRESMRRR